MNNHFIRFCLFSLIALNFSSSDGRTIVNELQPKRNDFVFAVTGNDPIIYEKAETLNGIRLKRENTMPSTINNAGAETHSGTSKENSEMRVKRFLQDLLPKVAQDMYYQSVNLLADLPKDKDKRRIPL